MACRNNAGAGTGAFRAAILAALLLAVPGAAPAHAQGTALHSSSYITPFPQTDRYQLRVIGDWLASGLAAGLQDALKNENPVQITDLSRPGFGLVRQNDLNNEIGRMLAGPPVHIVVIMLGANDRIAMRTETGRAQPGSEEWKELYGKEAEKLTKKLRAANVAVYWVGLPVMGNAATNEYAGMLNDTVRQAAYIAGAKFIETSAGFTDQSGAYSAWGPDVTGQTKRLREGDGQSLTAAGSRKLASYIEAALRRDLAQARSERNIPLAGDEEEQARVVPHPGATKAAANAPARPRLTSRHAQDGTGWQAGRLAIACSNRCPARPGRICQQQPARRIRAGRSERRPDLDCGDHACERPVHPGNRQANAAGGAPLFQGFEQRGSLARQGGAGRRLSLAPGGGWAVSIVEPSSMNAFVVSREFPCRAVNRKTQECGATLGRRYLRAFWSCFFCRSCRDAFPATPGVTAMPIAAPIRPAVKGRLR